VTDDQRESFRVKGAGTNMHKSIWAVVLVLFAVCWCSAQQNVALSPVVWQFVKIESPLIALTHVRVIDGTGSPVRENQTIVISGDKIQAIGDSSTAVVPSGARVLDLAGCTVIPGLVGMHDHSVLHD
jgi:adenine deaminase